MALASWTLPASAASATASGSGQPKSAGKRHKHSGAQDEDDDADKVGEDLMTMALGTSVGLQRVQAGVEGTVLVPQKSPLVDKLESAQQACHSAVEGLKGDHQYGPPHLSKGLALLRYVVEVEVPEAMQADQALLQGWVAGVAKFPVAEASLAVRACSFRECFQREGEGRR